MSTSMNQMNTSAHVGSSNYSPVDAVNRHDFGVQKNRKPASTGGGRAWSEDEVRSSLTYEMERILINCRRKFTSFKLVFKRCLISILPLTWKRLSWLAAFITINSRMAVTAVSVLAPCLLARLQLRIRQLCSILYHLQSTNTKAFTPRPHRIATLRHLQNKFSFLQLTPCFPAQALPAHLECLTTQLLFFPNHLHHVVRFQILPPIHLFDWIAMLLRNLQWLCLMLTRKDFVTSMKLIDHLSGTSLLLSMADLSLQCFWRRLGREGLPQMHHQHHVFPLTAIPTMVINPIISSQYSRWLLLFKRTRTMQPAFLHCWAL